MLNTGGGRFGTSMNKRGVGKNHACGVAERESLRLGRGGLAPAAGVEAEEVREAVPRAREQQVREEEKVRGRTRRR